MRRLLQDPDRAGSLTPRDRLKWCRQAAEGVVYCHTKGVTHSNISTQNLLLDNKLDVRLSSFDGVFVDETGQYYCGKALESAKSYVPHDTLVSDEKTDLFALETAMYEIMVGHELFPDLDAFADDEEIEGRFTRQEYPAMDGVVARDVIRKCWVLLYEEADECLRDLEALANLID